VAQSTHEGHDIILDSALSFYVNLNLSGAVVLLKTFPIQTQIERVPLLWPISTSGTMVLINNFILHNAKKLSRMPELFLAQWFLRTFLSGPTLFLHFCDYVPLEDGLAHYLNNFEFLLP
jgi:hypothetical protein